MSTLTRNEKLQRLSELKGAFENGMTDDDVEEVCGDLQDILGRHFVCLWAFDDMWGVGGDSCLYEMRAEGEFFEMAESLNDYLWEPDSGISAESILDDCPSTELAEIDRVTPEAYAGLSEEDQDSYNDDLSFIQVSDYNYVHRQDIDRELD